MKKVFFYVAAAMTMLAGCQKAELNQTQTPVDDTTPVAMQLGAATPSFTLTKAAVNEWASTPVFVYGLLNGENGYEAIIDNYATVVVDDKTPLEIYDDADLKMPYFYKEGKTYDFFGYHLGGAEKVTEPALAADVVAFEVKYDGNDDVMYAYADKAIDVMKDPTAQVREADAYSAWAARRNVQPNLVFKHALTKFNFIVKGMNAKSENVTVTGITVESVDNGTLTVVNKDASKLAFVPNATAEAVEFALTNWDDTEFTPVEVLNGVEIIAGGNDPLASKNSASIMVAPDMTELPVVVAMLNNKFNKELEPYTFTAKASDVRKVGLAENAGITKFEAGTAYNIYINVYGPEEIVVTAELTEWDLAGDYTYDPDAFRPDGTPSTFVAAKLESVEAGTMTAAFTTSDDIAALEAALKVKDADELATEYKEVALTKAMEGAVVFTGLDATLVYELVVRYKTDLAKDYTPVENVEVVAPAAATAIAATSVITDEASFNAFCSGQLTWYDDSTPQTLPWLAAKLEAGVKHANVVVTNEKGFKKTFNWAKADGTEIVLVTVSEEELGTKLVPGKWTLTVNGDSEDIVIPEPYKFEVLATGVITDEASFNEWTAGTEREGKWYPDSTPQTLPWLAVKCTPTKNVKVSAACGEVRASLEFTSDEDCTLLTLNADELGAEIVPGQTWYLNVNGVNVTIVVPNIAEAWLVKDVTSFKKLPTSYRANYGEWGTPGLAESLPWLAVTFINPVKSVKWSVAHNGKKVKSGSGSKEDGSDITLVTFNADELDTEIVAGTWTVTVNGASADIVVE